MTIETIIIDLNNRIDSYFEDEEDDTLKRPTPESITNAADFILQLEGKGVYGFGGNANITWLTSPLYAMIFIEFYDDKIKFFMKNKHNGFITKKSGLYNELKDMLINLTKSVIEYK
jgi:hypothetical protein